MASHIIVLDADVHYEIYWGRLSCILVKSNERINKMDQVVLHSDPQDPRSKKNITPLYKTVTYVGAANMPEGDFNYKIVSWR